MWAFMTTGTIPVLQKITEQYDDITFHYMRNGRSTLVYYESERKKGVFASGRAYALLHNSGQLNEKGFVVMEHIPVVEDAQDLFENNMQAFLPKLARAYGLHAIKFLKATKGLTYCMVTQWKSEEAYRTFESSSMHDFYQDAKLARKPAYFAERPFTSVYYMIEEDDQEETW